MKEQIKAPEEIQLSNEEIANLLDAEFKTLVIRTLTELIVLGRKIEEEVKAIQSEIKENVQGTKGERKETGTQINNLDQKEEINIQSKHSEETRIQGKKKKMRRGLGPSGTTLNLSSNIRIIGVQGE